MGKQTTRVKNVYPYLPLSKDSTALSLTRLASCRSVYLFRCYCWSTTYYTFTAGKLNMILLFESQAVINKLNRRLTRVCVSLRSSAMVFFVILAAYKKTFNYRKLENTSSPRWRNTKEIIINHQGTRMVRDG